MPCLPNPADGDARAGCSSRCAARADPAHGASSPTSTAPWRRSSSGPSRPPCRSARRELLAQLERALRPGRLRLRAPGRGGAAPGRRRGHRLRRQPRARAAAAGRRGAPPRPLAGGPRERARRSSSPALDAGALAAVGLRLEDKGPIQALHWRGAEDERAAEARAHEIAAEAGGPDSSRAGAARCSSCARPGAAARTPRSAALLAADGVTAAVYAGDDRTDLDAFRRLRELRDEGELETRDLRRRRLRRGARRSWPRSRDLTVDGPAGWLAMLESLAAVADALHRPAAHHRLPHRRRGDRAGGDHGDRREAATTDTDASSSPPAWWLIALVDRRSTSAARQRAADGVRDALARARTATSLPDETPARIALARLWPIGRDRRSSPASSASSSRRRRDRRRLRPARRARLAHPRGGGARRSSSATASSSTSSPTPPCARSSWSGRPGCAATDVTAPPPRTARPSAISASAF